MRKSESPRLEGRRAAEFERELLGRARAWLPDWSLDESEPDFGLALLKIAARFSSEVAERLDVAGDKMALGFLDWLGLRSAAARPARMPVVMKLAETAREPVTAPRPVKMQVDALDATVTFETESELRVVPGTLDAIVAVDPANDAYFLPPPGLSKLDPREPLPTAWRVKNFAAAKSKLLQLDPGLGLAEEMLIEIDGLQYRILKAKDDLVTIDPEVPAGGLVEGMRATKVEAFRPFDGSRNRQEHILYVGDPDLLNLDASARIELRGLPALPDETLWEYWGKDDRVTDANDADPRWRALTLGVATEPKALIVSKPNGAIEPTQVGSAQGRWIRARIDKTGPLAPTDKVSLRINPREDDTKPPPALTDPLGGAQLPPVDAFVNATPSATSDFYPLGREPKLFDTLYLGSEEAFSKAGATAWIHFDLGDSTFAALSTLRVGLFAIPVAAGVGGDGALHLFLLNSATPGLVKYRDLEPLKPPLSSADAADASAPRTSLDRKPGWKPPMWQDNGFFVATAAGSDVWLRFEPPVGEGSWRFGESVPSTAQQPGPIDGLVHLEGVPDLLFALRDGVLFRRQVGATGPWQSLETKAGLTTVKLKAIVPVMVEVGGFLFTSVAAGMIGVSEGLNPRLYKVTTNGACTPLLAGQDVSYTVRPAAGADATGANLVVVAASADGTQLVVHDDNGNSPSPAALNGTAVGGLEVIRHASEWHFLASVNDGNSRLVSWTPLGASPVLFESPRPAAFSPLGGGPAGLPGYVLAPGEGAEIFLIEFDLARRVAQPATILAGIVIPTAFGAPLVPSDTVAALSATPPIRREIIDFGVTTDQETLYPIDSEFPANAGPPLIAYRTTGSPLVGSPDPLALDEFTLGLDDAETAIGNWLLIDDEFHEVTGFVDATSNPRVVNIAPDFTNAAGAGLYFRPLLTGGRRAPFLRLNPASDGNWDAALLDRVPLRFPGAVPDRQAAKAYAADISNHPILVVLGGAFTSLPASPTFVVDAAAGEWALSLGDTSTNPNLAWEYWNGTGWWQLPLELDQTGNLKTSGVVRFQVPSDMSPTDWAGKTNHWVRARLIGGDYGKETVKVVTKPVGGGQTEQTVVRTTEGFQPPYALDVRVAYAVDSESVPRFLLTQDSGTVRDQSDANRTPGAEVEIFTPLSVTLAKFDLPAAGDAGAGQCAPDCDCPTGTASSSPVSRPQAPSPATGAGVVSRQGRRALYLGFTAKLYGEPINLLFLVAREGAYDRIAPLAVDALVGDRFAAIVAADETRALGETGLLKMAFNVEPIQAELFGRTLSWLRLTPTGGDADWLPSLAGVYPNAVWARAAETMTREPLGSSDGRPALNFNIARPPLLQDTLELRVREPLGEEERTALLEHDPDLIKREIPDLPGDWVLWKQVPDPVDWGPTDRVYALDEATGTIRFGDGLHGMIPPAGIDAVVAFAYQRTEPIDAGGEVAANFVLPRMELNLVTPVESVETVVAADRSAGGVAPEKAERVLRFAPATLRHRGRAVSARDFQDLARQNSAEVVQARCFVHNGRIRMVVAMRGDSPWPSRAQQRELRRMLLEVAPASLAVPGALTITGPTVRRLRTALVLRVATLDVAGTVAAGARDRLIARFDIEHGGEAGEGWPLGSSPREDDIAEALLDLPELKGIVSISLLEVDELGGEQPWRSSVGASELVMLAPKDVRIGFDVLEAVE